MNMFTRFADPNETLKTLNEKLKSTEFTERFTIEPLGNHQHSPYSYYLHDHALGRHTHGCSPLGAAFLSIDGAALYVNALVASASSTAKK